MCHFEHLISISKSRTQYKMWGWSGGAMVLGKLPVPGRPTILITEGQGQQVRVGVFWTFFCLSSIPSIFCLPLFGRRPDID